MNKEQQKMEKYQKKNNTREDIYYKGIAESTFNNIRETSVIQGKYIDKGKFQGYGVYVSKSEKVANEYGEIVLKLNLAGHEVVKSPHSNQFIAKFNIPAWRIVSVNRANKSQKRMYQYNSNMEEAEV